MSSEKKEVKVKICKHIRSKETFHCESPLDQDDFHSGIFWCNQTGDGMGPDGACADSEDCVPGRACYGM